MEVDHPDRQVHADRLMPQQRHATILRADVDAGGLVQEERPLRPGTQQAPQPRITTQQGYQRRHAAHSHAAGLSDRLPGYQHRLLRRRYRLQHQDIRDRQSLAQSDRGPVYRQHDSVSPHGWQEQPPHQDDWRLVRHFQPPPPLVRSDCHVGSCRTRPRLLGHAGGYTRLGHRDFRKP